MVIPPIWLIGSARRRRERGSKLEKLSQEDEQTRKDVDLAVKMFVYPLVGTAALVGVGYFFYELNKMPDYVWRAMFP